MTTRLQLSEIERTINEDIYVKGLMIDRDEFLSVSEGTFLNMDLAKRLINRQKSLIHHSTTIIGSHARSRVLIFKESIKKRNRVD